MGYQLWKLMRKDRLPWKVTSTQIHLGSGGSDLTIVEPRRLSGPW